MTARMPALCAPRMWLSPCYSIFMAGFRAPAPASRPTVAKGRRPKPFTEATLQFSVVNSASRRKETFSSKHPKRHLGSYAGLTQADAYAGFNRLYGAFWRRSRIQNSRMVSLSISTKGDVLALVKNKESTGEFCMTPGAPVSRGE
jgi:hypothetical protein